MPAPHRTAQQRDARELALTRPANPYRGGLRDPFASRPAAPAVRPAGWSAAPAQRVASARLANQPAAEPTVTALPRTSGGTPGQATFAGTVGIVLGLALALFGISLLMLVSLQNQYGAPDRSFYRGTDSSYVILGLIDFALAIGCVAGAIMLLGGRVTGRVAITVAGWGALGLSAFWQLRGHPVAALPIGVALAAAALLLCSYHRSVTDWLGVLPPPQPE